MSFPRPLANGQKQYNAYNPKTGEFEQPVNLTSAIITNPTITNPTVTGGTLTNPTITNPTVTGGTLTNPTLTNPTVTGGTLTNPTITNPTITGGTITGSTIANATLTNADIVINDDEVLVLQKNGMVTVSGVPLVVDYSVGTTTIQGTLPMNIVGGAIRPVTSGWYQFSLHIANQIVGAVGASRILLSTTTAYPGALVILRDSSTYFNTLIADLINGGTIFSELSITAYFDATLVPDVSVRLDQSSGVNGVLDTTLLIRRLG